MPSTTISISKPSGTPSNKPQIKNIQHFDGNKVSLTPASELKLFQRPKESISNPLAKRPITKGMPPNVEHIQHKVMRKNASSPKRQRLQKINDADDICIIEEKIEKTRESTGKFLQKLNFIKLYL